MFTVIFSVVPAVNSLMMSAQPNFKSNKSPVMSLILIFLSFLNIHTDINCHDISP